MIQLSLTQVGKSFAARAPGVQGRVMPALLPTDLAVRRGEFVCLLGASGCGKSTLLNLIAGIETPSSGEIQSGGARVTGPGVDRVLMFQDAALFPWLTVIDNVAFGLKQAGVPKLEREQRAADWLSRVGLSGFERHLTHQISGGMRQRVALARALAIDPDILLMDEPFGALDALTRDALHHLLESVWAATGKTIVFVTHNVREAVALGDRVLVFSPRPGRVIGEFRIDLPRPRSLDDVAVVKRGAAVMDVLRGALAADPSALEGAFI
jgi:NitT/TauT family transport system ATP-binding protein